MPEHCDDVARAAPSQQHEVAVQPLQGTAVQIILLLLSCSHPWQQFLQQCHHDSHVLVMLVFRGLSGRIACTHACTEGEQTSVWQQAHLQVATDAPSKTIAGQFQHRQLYLACTANHLPVEWLVWYVTLASVLGWQANGNSPAWLARNCTGPAAPKLPIGSCRSLMVSAPSFCRYCSACSG